MTTEITDNRFQHLVNAVCDQIRRMPMEELHRYSTKLRDQAQRCDKFESDVSKIGKGRIDRLIGKLNPLYRKELEDQKAELIAKTPIGDQLNKSQIDQLWRVVGEQQDKLIQQRIDGVSQKALEPKRAITRAPQLKEPKTFLLPKPAKHESTRVPSTPSVNSDAATFATSEARIFYKQKTVGYAAPRPWMRQRPVPKPEQTKATMSLLQGNDDASRGYLANMPEMARENLDKAIRKTMPSAKKIQIYAWKDDSEQSVQLSKRAYRNRDQFLALGQSTSGLAGEIIAKVYRLTAAQAEEMGFRKSDSAAVAIRNDSAGRKNSEHDTSNSATNPRKKSMSRR